MTAIRNLILSDLMIMKGGKKNNMISLYITMLIFMLAGGFCISPLGGLVTPLMFSVIPMMIVQNEMKYHCEKLSALLPVRRRDVVNARFLLSLGIYLLASAAVYPVMLLSLKLRFYETITEEKDILFNLVEKLGSFTELGLFNLIFCITFSFGLVIMTKTLKQLFEDNSSAAALFGLQQTPGVKRRNKELIRVVVSILLVLLAFLCITGIIPIGTTAALIIKLLIQLAKTANGVLLSVMLLFWAICKMLLVYISTVVNYEKKEL